MQSGICSFSRLEMASKRMKTFIFKNVIKIKYEEVNYLVPAFTKDISALRKPRNFFLKKQINQHHKIFKMSAI